MTKIKVITPPDIIYSNTFSIVLICPGDWIRRSLQSVLETINIDVNVYFLEENNLDVNWMLSLLNFADVILFDIDNSPNEIKNLSSYLISHDNVFWLTNVEYMYYNKLSVNRVYDLEFLQETIGGYLEKQKRTN